MWPCPASWGYHHHHHHHVALSARISLTLTRQRSLSSIASGRSSGLHSVAAVCRFELVILTLHVHVKGTTEECHLRIRPYFSSSDRDVWFV